VIEIAGDREHLDQPRHRAEPFESVLDLRGPIGVGDETDAKAPVRRGPDTAEQDGVIEERFAPLEVDPLDVAQCPGLLEDPLDLIEGHGAALAGAGPHEAVVALVVALVRQQQVETGELHDDLAVRRSGVILEPCRADRSLKAPRGRTLAGSSGNGAGPRSTAVEV
jgi:hypothetical protein